MKYKLLALLSIFLCVLTACTEDKKEQIDFGRAICYSGYRDGQAPGQESPTYEQVKEDLLILQGDWDLLRLYAMDEMTYTTLEVIAKEKLEFKVMLGAYIGAEVNNPNCSWGGVYELEVLEENKVKNEQEIRRLIAAANKYKDIVIAVSAGNEACVDWNDHMVPVESVINYVKMVQAEITQPVTFCDNYVPWTNKLAPLAEVVDFISIHTYPVWENKTIDEALDYTKQNYNQVASLYRNKQVIITEAGWTTNSNGRGIAPENANQELQKTYVDQLRAWVAQDQIVCFVFEAFDESWKGSGDPMEPEKHWGLYHIDRTPKLVTQK